MFERLFKYPLELYRDGSVTFAGPLQLELRILGAIGLAVVVLWLYRRMPSQVSRAKRRVVIALRSVAAILLLFIIFPPVLVTANVRSRDRFVAVLVDDSRSMSIEDTAGGESRRDVARRIVFGRDESDDDAEADTDALVDMTRTCGVRVFRFADDIERLTGPHELKAQGPVTDVFTALKGVEEKLRGVPLAAVVLVSDGNHNTAGDLLSAARLMAAKRVPVYTMGLGSQTPPKDFEVVDVHAPKKVRRKSSVDIVATVRSYGYTEPYVALLRREDEIVARTTVQPRSTSDLQRVTFGVFLEREGTYIYRVEIPTVAGEKISRNNMRDVQVEVEEARLPVLYIEGSPRTEFRFLRGALFEDDDFRIVSILRLGKKRFLVQGSDDESLKNGYPTKKEELFRYEAIIFGDIEASFFTKQQLQMTEQFVSERGGGFLMLGGVNSFNRGGYHGTPIAKLLPLVLENAEKPYDRRQFRIQVAQGGVTHPIMHQTSDPLANRNVWNTVSPLMGHNPVRGLKSGAIPLMESIVGREPVLAVQDYGIGRTAAFTTGGSWFWQMDRAAGDKLHQRFWKQLVRWLAMGSKPKLSMELKTVYAQNEKVLLAASVLGKSLEPVNDAVVRARVEDPFGHAEDLPLEWILSEDGVYQGTYVPRERGEHKVVVTAQYADSKDKLEVSTSFLVGESYIEFRSGWQNASFLKKLSLRTGGAHYGESDVSQLIARVERRIQESAGAKPDFTRYDLWDMPVLFVLLLATLSAEWFIKRRSGIP